MKKCKFCEKVLENQKNKFCNQSCAASFNNKGVRRHGKAPNSCAWCGKETRGKFCSTKCCNEYKTAINLNKWMLFHEGWGGAKAHIFKVQGYKCNHCGIKDWNGRPLSFELEHIDGNAQNNRRENLEVICPNCHSQTSTFRGKNVGNPSRARYYYKVMKK